MIPESDSREKRGRGRCSTWDGGGRGSGWDDSSLHVFFHSGLLLLSLIPLRPGPYTSPPVYLNLLQLAYCVVQFLEKESSLTEPVIPLPSPSPLPVNSASQPACRIMPLAGAQEGCGPTGDMDSSEGKVKPISRKQIQAS